MFAVADYNSGLKELIRQIQGNFLKIEDLIEKHLSGDAEVQTQIEEIFKNIKSIIEVDEFQENESLYRHFKYLYHSKNSIYLKVVHRDQEAETQEKLSKKHESFRLFNLDISSDGARDFVDAPGDTQGNFLTSFLDFDSAEMTQIKNEHIEFIFQKLSKFVAPEPLKEIKQLFNQTLLNVPEKFTDYVQLVTVHDQLNRVLDELLLKLHECEVDATESRSQINELRIIALTSFYKLQIKFMENLLLAIDSQQSALFSDMSLTEENLKKRYRQLCRLFHPDKATWIWDKDMPTLLRFFNLIQENYQLLLTNLEEKYAKSTKFNFYEQNAIEYWERSLDYRHALKGEWDQLKHEDSGLLRTLSKEQLNARRIELVELSYQEYKICCKIGDQNKQLADQIRLRGTMALCKYSMGGHFNLEAQLYALSAMHLILDNSQHTTNQDLVRAKEILDKVRGKIISKTSPLTPSSTPTAAADNLSQALVLVQNDKSLSLSTPVGQQYSFRDRQRMTHALDQELKEIANQLMLRTDGTVVRYTASEEEILRAKRRGTAHKVVGGTAAVAGVTAGGVIVVGAGIEVLQGVGVVAGAALGGPVVAIIGGIAAIGLGIWAGYNLIKKGNEILKEPEVRETLNTIMLEALGHYKKSDFSAFIQVLSREYQPGVRLLSLRTQTDVIDPQQIIGTLLKHGFRPDGIAYLLNLIGESFNTGTLNIPGLTGSDLRERSKQIFQGVLSQKLEESAKELDDRVSSLRKKDFKNMLKNQESFLKDFIFLRDTGTIASEHLNDSEEMTFKARLEEMRNTARINIAIMRVLGGNQEDLDDAKKIVDEVRKSINDQYQFVSNARSRLEVLEDFLWVVSGQPYEESVLLITHIPLDLSDIVEEKPDQNSLNYWQASLEKATSDIEKVKIYNKRALHYEKLAQANERLNYIASLSDWQEAQRNYFEAIKLMPTDINAGIGFARCLLNLSYYNQVVDFLNNNKHLSKIPDYWIMAAIAYRKKYQYRKASACIIEALKIDPKNLKADQERTLLARLKSNPVFEKKEIYKQPLDTEAIYLTNRKSIEQPFYKILSIDGGGIRGVMPAFWLSEIERSIKRPISHLFNLIAGTSTGGIIAAGLSAPLLERKMVGVETIEGVDVPIFDKVPCSYRPQYTAFDILELYREQGPRIFTPHQGGGFFDGYGLRNARPFNSKYSADGRRSLFIEYFEERTLRLSLTDLVIPAVNEEGLHCTHLFSTKRARIDRAREDQKLVDVLMATTAAPTFFPHHQIKGRGVFVDGGLHLNNPAQAAYHEAIGSDVSKDKVFVLSLGTGSCIPDPLNPEACRGLLFWAQNLHKVALPAQEGNVDTQMYQSLGERYQRWQPRLEIPVALDDYQTESISNLLETGRQYIEELYDSDDNRLGKLLELLQNDVDSFVVEAEPNSTSGFTPAYANSNPRVSREGLTNRNQSLAMRRFAGM